MVKIPGKMKIFERIEINSFTIAFQLVLMVNSKSA